MTLWGQQTRAHQSRVDAIVASARAQAPAPVPTHRQIYREAPRSTLTPSENLLDLRLEEELAFVRRTLEAIGERLCDDPILLNRYATVLQSFDMLGQTLGHIGAVIGAEDKEEAVDRIGMVELRARLSRGTKGNAESTPALYRSASNPFSQY